MTDNNSMAANLVKRRGNRCTATLLSWMEKHIKHQISEDLWQDMRREVMYQVNDFKDLAIDIVGSETAILNELYVEKVDEIRQELRRIRG